MFGLEVRPVGDGSRSRLARSWGSRLASVLLVAVTAGGLTGCKPEVLAKNDKGLTYCCRYLAYNGKPAGSDEKAEPKHRPIGPNAFALYQRVKFGMTPAQVVKLAGNPQKHDIASNPKDGECYIYQSDGRVDVAFLDGKVDSLIVNGPDLIDPNWGTSGGSR